MTSDDVYDGADSISVVDFGADPTGEVDSTSAFIAAMLACVKAGVPLDVPHGARFKVSAEFQEKFGPLKGRKHLA